MQAASLLSALFSLFVLFVCVCHTIPVDNKDTMNQKESKSAFGQAFDEIVVESSLTVRRKSPGRQGRNQNTTEASTTGIIKTKREVNRRDHHNSFQIPQRPRFSAVNSQSQSSDVDSDRPSGRFGASSAGSQFQSFGKHPSAGFAGTQHYNFNGQTIDVSFGQSNSKAGAVTVTGPNGRKKSY